MESEIRPNWRRILEGRTEDLAPPPTRYGVSRLIYDILDANGGSGTLKQIEKMVPAAQDPKNPIEFTPEQFIRAFDSLRFNGRIAYYNGNHSYRIAPRSHYEAVQKKLKERRRELDATKRIRPRYSHIHPRELPPNPEWQSDPGSQATVINVENHDKGKGTVRLISSHILAAIAGGLLTYVALQL